MALRAEFRKMKSLLIAFLLLSSTSVKAEKKVLMIGDSHSVLSFGKTLATEIPSTNRYAISSSASSDWLKKKICPITGKCPFVYGYATPEGEFNETLPSSFEGLRPLLRRTKANTVIVALGTNDANQRCQMKPSKGTQPVRELLRSLGGRQCYWVGPPSYRWGPVFESCGENFNKYVDRMKTLIEAHHCKFIDSRLIIDPDTGLPIEANSGDGIHFDEKLGAFWAQQAARVILQ